ncbi:hypothetical protein TYRP_015203 [Tyrophagus putrescentiae]|nr:hypothetical protein TYRP_015203 [Tyrophagus putrescentiae]
MTTVVFLFAGGGSGGGGAGGDGSLAKSGKFRFAPADDDGSGGGDGEKLKDVRRSHKAKKQSLQSHAGLGRSFRMTNSSSLAPPSSTCSSRRWLPFTTVSTA